MTNVGIVGIGTYLPKNIMTAKEISDATGGVWSEDAVRAKLGINQKYIPSADPCDGTQEMGALAAIKCLENCGVDSNEWTGFAFGLGLDRIAMLKNGVNNIHILYDGDVRALKQFKD